MPIVAKDGRLAWFEAEADPEFWRTYFAEAITPEVLAEKSRKTMEDDEVGQIVAKAFPRSAKIVEIGTGGGGRLATLVANGWDIEGVDTSTELVERMHEVAPQLPVRAADGLALDVEDGHYGGYLSVGVVEHLEDGPEPFLVEAHRVLQPGGIAVITVPFFGPVRRLRAALHLYAKDRGGLPFYQYAFKTDEISRLIAEAGFRILWTRPYSCTSLLRQEVRGFARLHRSPSGRRVEELIRRVLGRYDGHMVAVIAERI